MKKAFMFVAAIAMISAPLFAEITFSGDFEVRWAHEFTDNAGTDTYLHDNENTAELDFGIMAGDYTTLSATFAAYPDDTTILNNVDLDSWSIKQDITGALGFDGPFTFSVEAGALSFEGKQFVTPFGEYAEFDTKGEDVDFIISSTIADIITIDLGFFPTSYMSNRFDFGANLYATIDPISVSATYVSEDGTHDMEYNVFLDMAPIVAGLQYQVMNIEHIPTSEFNMQGMLAADYTSDFGLTAGFEYYMTEIATALDMDLDLELGYDLGMIAVDADFRIDQMLETDVTGSRIFGIGVGVSLEPSEVVELHVNYDINDFGELADSMVINAGTDLTIGAMSYSVDYEFSTGNDDATDDVFVADMDHTVSVYATVSF